MVTDKGQLISNADWRAIDSLKKRMDEFVLIAFFTINGKQIRFVRLFFGRIYGVPICFSVLSDLQMLIRCSRVLEPLDKCSDAKNSQAASSGLLTGAGAYLQKSAQSSRDQAFGVAVEFSMPKTPGFFFFLLFHPTWQLASCDLTLIDAGLEKMWLNRVSGFKL